MWEVEVTCRETVKPFTPTPPHLRTHKLSWVDRIPYDDDHVPFILFYSTPDPGYLPTLKHSLSRALAAFYPLAGRLNGDLTSVDCNDLGAGLFEARAVADAPLPRLIPSYSSSRLPDNIIDARYLHMLLPCSHSSCSKNSAGPLLNVQITTFAPCGGISVGCCFSHKVADGQSATMFVDAWVAFARGRGYDVPVDFGAASHFVQPSPDDRSWYNTNWPTAVGLTPPHGHPIKEERVVARMFVIKESAIRRLVESSSLPHLTRAQAVIALIWRCCARAGKRNGKPRSTVACTIVNMRGRGSAALPLSLFGNLWCPVAAWGRYEEDGDSERARSMSEERVHAAIRGIDEKRVATYRSRGGWSSMLEGVSDAVNQVKNETGSADAAQHKYEFSSLLRFSSFYVADFGWGKPIWMTVGDLIGKNFVVLMARWEAPGGGIEAWVTLEENEMTRFERDEELLNCLSIPNTGLLKSSL